MAGEAIEKEPLDRFAAPSTELREEDGNATDVRILSTFGCREEEELEEASGSARDVDGPAPKCELPLVDAFAGMSKSLSAKQMVDMYERRKEKLCASLVVRNRRKLGSVL